MPKKTKKEKLLASYHRKLRMLENKETTSPVQIKIVTSKIILETKTEIAEPVNQYFFSDLKKSLLLIVLIIGIEVGLYATKLVK